MHAPILVCINQHNKFQAPGFTDYKDMIGAKFKKLVTWPWRRPLGVVCHHKASTWHIKCKIFATLVSAVPDIWLRTSKLEKGHVTLTTPLSWVICRSFAGTWYSLPVQNLTTLASTVPEIWLVPIKILMVHVTWPRTFQGWSAIRELIRVLATIKLSVIFEVSIFTHYEGTKGGTKWRKWGGLGSYGSLKVTGNSAIW